ncbi:hypothetical protein GCM10009104_06220 [Marinobacterium maritimum]|uniref:Thioredoxin-like fold domain-containing protein n=1 Tax=Marinobacterium maritimum TaxID=500162 RepID=A0ABN1I2J9_9GAMM
MRFLAPLLLILFSLPSKASDGLTFFTGFDVLRDTQAEAQVLILLFSQPECGYCDQVRDGFLLPLQQQQRPELVIRELKVPGFEDVRNRDNQVMTPRAFAQSYAINFYPSVLMLSLDGAPLTEPLVGISSVDFYGYYLDQAIEQALAVQSQ